MKISALLNVFSLSIGVFAAPQKTGTARFGIGFSLSLDYGTSTVYFANGTVVNVAKIEGSRKYKALMRELKPAPTAFSVQDVSAGVLTAVTNGRAKAQNVINTFVKTGVSKKSLPVGFSKKQGLRKRGLDPKADPFVFLISVLREATEVFLEERVTTADITLPFTVSATHNKLLSSACDHLYLQTALPQPHDHAGVMATMANKIAGQCTGRSKQPPQNVLAVDYSRAALTLTLIKEECASYKERSVFHDLGLGTAELERCAERKGERSCRYMLAGEIRKFVSQEIQTSSAGIAHVVLLGESANDVRLAAALKEVFGNKFETSDVGVKNIKSIDTAFAASGGTASASWRHFKR